jgi:hypothetical protein
MFSKLPKALFSRHNHLRRGSRRQPILFFSNVVFKYFKTIFWFFFIDLARTRPEVYEYGKKSEIFCFKGLKFVAKSK